MFTKTEIELAPKVYEAIKKIAKAKGRDWEWKPKVGEWCIINNQKSTSLILLVDKEIEEMVQVLINHTLSWQSKKNLIPLLHWEKLEKIMEGLGYYVILWWDNWYKQWNCRIIKNEEDKFPSVRGKTRQEAVMRAIIRLGEEIGQ